MRKRNLYSLIILSIVVFQNCSNRNDASTDLGYFSLEILEEHEFSPTINHGEIDKFRVTLQTDQIGDIEAIYPNDASTATFEGIQAGTSLNVEVEVLNYNGFVIRRGLSDEVQIQANEILPIEVEVFNVPVFANIYDGKIVKANRFIPKIYAQNDVNFQISDHFNDESLILTDEVSGDDVFTTSDEDINFVKPVYSSPLEVGEHIITVQDVHTGQSTSVTIEVVPSQNPIPFLTTSGSHINGSHSLSSVQGFTNYMNTLTQEQ